jgi:hypothetical protein
MVQTRKTVYIRELIETDSFGEQCNPVSRVAVAAIFKNPLIGRFETDLSPLFDIGSELGERLAEVAIAMLDGPPVSYGKAAIVGVLGDMEHGGAVIHPRLGAPMRAAAGGGKAVIPSNVKIGASGASIDMPLGHKGLQNEKVCLGLVTADRRNSLERLLLSGAAVRRHRPRHSGRGRQAHHAFRQSSRPGE